MKKIIILILVSFISFGLTAQIQPQEHLLSHQMNNDEHMLIDFPAIKGNSALHQSQNNKQRLDSLIEECYYETLDQWHNYRKERYKYDAYGNTVEKVRYKWNDVTSVWIPIFLYEDSYDENGNHTLSSHNIGWDNDIQQWESGLKVEYSYDENDLLVTLLAYDWNQNTWDLLGKTEYFYDNDNKLIRKQGYEWNNSQWLLSSKEEYTYDANDYVSLSRRYSWDDATATWENWGRREYEYNADGFILSDVLYSWYTIAQEWRGFVKGEYEYDSNNNRILSTSWLRSQDTGLWEFWNKGESEYDNNSNRTLYISYHWNQDTGLWDPRNKNESDYDVSQNHTLSHFSSWDIATNQWVSDYKNNYNYDNAYPYSELIVPFTEAAFRHKRISESRDSWDENTSQWITNIDRNTYYYSEQTVGIENIVQAGIKVFPNPADDRVFFDLPTTQTAEIKLYDAQGKLIDIQRLNNKQISVKHLYTGVYFYQLSQDNHQYGGTLIVK